MPAPTTPKKSAIQMLVTMRPTGKTLSARPGTSYGVGCPAAAAAICSCGCPKIDFGSVALPAAFEKTPALKEASVEEREVLTAFCEVGFVPDMEI